MMMASMMGAIAFQKGLGITHSCAHALSTVADLHHGFANGVMIDHALRFNLEASAEKFQRMAQVVGLADADGRRLPALAARAQGEDRHPGRPHGGRRRSRAELDRLSHLAFEDTCHMNNPRPVREEDFRGSTRRPSRDRGDAGAGVAAGPPRGGAS